MKLGVRLFIILVVAIFAVGAGSAALTHAQTAIEGTQVNCQVYFLDGPKQGETEPVAFNLALGGLLTADSSDYVGGMSTSGNWQSSHGSSVLNFTFTAQLAVAPGGTLTVTIAFPSYTNPMVGTSQGTIVDSNGNVLVVTHTTTTCPEFTPPT